MNTIMRTWAYAAISGAIFFVDRIVKLLAIAWCQDRWIINQYIACDLAFNRGISWGFFHSDSTAMFLIVTIIIATITIAIAAYGIHQFLRGYMIIGEILIVSGSLSNLIDRFYYKGVIDFIELSYNGYTWPLFNVADSCIVLGTLIMIMELYKK